MENNKLERIIFMLLRVFGVLAIIGGFLEEDRFFAKENLLVLNHKTIIGDVYMLSPSAIVGMLVTIIIYLVFLRIIAKHITISKKSI